MSTKKSRRMRRKAAVAVIAFALFVTACSQQAPPPTIDRAEKPATVSPPNDAHGGLQPRGAEEFIAAIISCMAQAGFVGTAVQGGGIAYEGTPVEQRSQFEAAEAACEESASALVPTSAPVNEALLVLAYDRTQAAISCYEENGFPAPRLESYQQWRDDMYAGKDYDLTSEVRAAESAGGPSFLEAGRLCPNPIEFLMDPWTRIYEEDVDYEKYFGAAG